MFSWLTQSSTGGFAAWLCALALRELANATADPHQLAAADQAFQQLPAPASGLEAAVLSALKSETRPLKPHDHVSDLDGLRLAVVVTARNVKIAPGLFSTELGRILAAALKA